MNSTIASLSPTPLWKNFSLLNAVPRPSKKEERVIAFMENFGNSLGLETTTDHVGNVLIKKPATAGMENRQTIVLQSHLDMVHQKNADTIFDFDTEGIKMIVVDDWVKGDGTTLGADNGIGVATMMAVLESSDIEHPAIEALFTIDEETGMTGAIELKAGVLSGSIMLNLDTEEDDELTIGCAGGIDVTSMASYTEENIDPENWVAYKLSLKGLNGGHSGMEIHKGLGNSNKLMNRILHELSNDFGIRIHSVEGGSLRNAIPRESFAQFFVKTGSVSGISSAAAKWNGLLLAEHKSIDSGVIIELKEAQIESSVLPISTQADLLKGIHACPNGIYRMSPDIPGLVQTSNNLARVEVKEGKITIMCLTRSSVESEKMDLANSIQSCFSLASLETEFGGTYPGWAPNPTSQIVDTMRSLYKELFKEDANVSACHAGLECGILGKHYPEMEMISFGPTIRGAHSPDERVQISSVQKFWGFFIETLKRIPMS